MIKILGKVIGLLKLAWLDRDLLRYARYLKDSQRTYLSYPQLASLAANYFRLRKTYKEHLQVAEFGVGRGGSAMLLAWLVQRYGGRLILYDVFGRIPAPSPADGASAENRYQVIVDSEDESYYGNIENLLGLIQQEISEVCSLDKVIFTQGLFEKILPNLNDALRFNLVHIDCDWYDSVGVVLNYLQTRLTKDGVIQVDDYYYWHGAHKAVDECPWLASIPRERIEGAAVLKLTETR